MNGGRFVTRVNQIDAGIQRSIEYRHDVITRQREYALNTGPLKCLCNDVGTAKSHHPGSLNFSFPADGA